MPLLNAYASRVDYGPMLVVPEPLNLSASMVSASYAPDKPGFRTVNYRFHFYEAELNFINRDGTIVIAPAWIYIRADLNI